MPVGSVQFGLTQNPAYLESPTGLSISSGTFSPLEITSTESDSSGNLSGANLLQNFWFPRDDMQMVRCRLVDQHYFRFCSEFSLEKLSGNLAEWIGPLPENWRYVETQNRKYAT